MGDYAVTQAAGTAHAAPVLSGTASRLIAVSRATGDGTEPPLRNH